MQQSNIIYKHILLITIIMNKESTNEIVDIYVEGEIVIN